MRIVSNAVTHAAWLEGEPIDRLLAAGRLPATSPIYSTAYPASASRWPTPENERLEIQALGKLMVTWLEHRMRVFKQPVNAFSLPSLALHLVGWLLISFFVAFVAYSLCRFEARVRVMH